MKRRTFINTAYSLRHTGSMLAWFIVHAMTVLVIAYNLSPASGWWS